MSNGLTGKLAWTADDPLDARLRAVLLGLAAEDARAADGESWPEALWDLLESVGAPRWTLPAEYGGESCPRPRLIQRYAQLAGGSLTGAFILSQHDAAIRRLLGAREQASADHWLRALGEGRALATVGLSHLTTSRRLGTQAIRAALVVPGRYRLEGTMPWVTAAGHADVIVTGAVLADGRQMLIAVPADCPGLEVCPPFPLAALQASCTAQVELHDVEVNESDVLAGPALDLMAQPGAVGTAGLETSALAAGQARAALLALVELSPDRNDLVDPLEVLCESWATLWQRILAQARGEPDPVNPSEIRARANALVLRATQAYLAARKGTGFLLSEPAQRWARQALFFLVWSCPAPIAQAVIRDLAGLCQA
jgi:alkylation response protein AidB-like acyl-CoA dehydrogenase